MAYDDLKNIITTQGGNTTDIASIIGRSKGVASNIFAGRRPLKIEEAYAIAKVYNATVDIDDNGSISFRGQGKTKPVLISDKITDTTKNPKLPKLPEADQRFEALISDAFKLSIKIAKKEGITDTNQQGSLASALYAVMRHNLEQGHQVDPTYSQVEIALTTTLSQGRSGV